MTIPDGAEYWWDIRGYGDCYESEDNHRRRNRGKDMSPEAVAARKARHDEQLALECQRCGHPLGRHGRHKGPKGKRRHGGQCNFGRSPEGVLGCLCPRFVPKPENAERYRVYLGMGPVPEDKA